jgi:signal transduction histidine kinase
MHASGEQLSVSVCVLRVAVQGEYYLALVLDKATLAGKDDASVFQLPELLVEHRRRAVSSQQANEVEKKRFSRKLYDDIGQRLSVLKLDLDWLENSLSDADACFPARLAEMQGLLDNVISMTKSMASALRPPLLDDFGLLPAVEWIAENFSKKTSIACTVENNSMVGKLDEAVESAVFRIVQESLSNIERHACAQHAKIILTQCKDRLDVMIQDDGIGMTTGCENKLGCYGLIAMQERVFVLGGTIYIRHIKPHGVCIHASLPLEPIFNATQCSIPSTRNL